MRIFLRNTTILFCFLLFVFTSANAQNKSRKMIKADQAFSVEQYNKAAELYKKAFQSAKSRAIKSEIIFKQAECYRLSGNKKKS
jgi:peptidoglycan-associated lipoprotein